ncbi:MAG: hypothetical protein IJY86_07505 [Clostridia bacterium]|nr:hypothetical protein [Clostridia bacterium]
MINKEKYLAELKKVLAEMYPMGNYTKVQLIGNDSLVRNKMDDYVMRNYREYYENELIQLIKAKNSLYNECVEKLFL